MRNILSLDLSSKSTGCAVSVDGNLVSYECISSSSTDVIKRIYIMRDRIKELLRQYNINEVVLEEVRTDYKNIHTYKILTWLQAAIVFVVYDYNPKIEIKYMQPSEWRSKIGIHTGRGIKRELLKKEDIKYVKNKYGISANDDICDSICLLDAYLTDKDDLNWE